MLRYCRNLALVWLGTAVVVASTWATAQWLTGRRVDRARAKLVSMGLPSKLADLQRPPIPDSLNAALAFRAAASKISSAVWSPSDGNTTWDLNQIPFPTGWWLEANASAGANAPVFLLALAAAKLTDSDEGLPYARGAMATAGAVWHLNEYRSLCNTLVDEMVRLHMTGDDGAAIDLLNADFSLADALYKEPLLVEYLTAKGIEDYGEEYVPLIASGITIGTEPREARPDQIRAIISRLLKDKTPVITRTMLAESLWTAASADDMDQHAFLTVPAYQRFAAVALEAASGSTVKPVHEPIFQPNYWSQWVDTAREVAQIHQRNNARRNLAAITLAIALYRSEHAGQFPASLADLVPTDLPTTPADSTSEMGGVWTYHLANNGTRPVLIFVPTSAANPPDAALTPTPNYLSGAAKGSKVPWFVDLSRITTPAPTTAPSARNP